MSNEKELLGLYRAGDKEDTYHIHLGLTIMSYRVRGLTEPVEDELKSMYAKTSHEWDGVTYEQFKSDVEDALR